MKALLTLAVAIGIGLVTGCSMMDIDDVTTTTTKVVAEVPVTVTEHKVAFSKNSLLMNSSMDQASLDYGPAKLKIGGYSNTGDTETTRVIADGIIGGITAYFTAGASSVAKGVVKGMSASSVADTVKDAVIDKTEEPEAPSVAPDVSAPPPKPIITKVNTASDVVAGKYAVVVIGNRKGCPLCRSLWKEGFEANVEQALPNADVIDADMTDNPQLYKKYFPSEKFVYPYCVIFDAQGKRIGAFTARGEGASNFTGKVSEICPSCKP